ncbi:MAG: family 43 glycosylhydrolase [Bacilli bacterium]|jgi:arabinan endo-1,5-alpha-L-arabinosidase
MKIKIKSFFLVLTTILWGCTKPPLENSVSEDIYKEQGDVNNSYTNRLPIHKQNGEEEFVPTADPFCFRDDDGTFYLYCSNTYCTQADDAEVTLDYGPIFKSQTMTSWQWCGSVFRGQETYALWNNGEGGVWAPTVIKINNHYNFYYTLGAGGFYSEYTGIGVATSPTPYGPWTHYGKVFNSGEIGVANSIDPYVFIDDGKILMAFGSGDGIWIVELNADGTALKDGLQAQYNNKRQIAGFNIFQQDNYEACFIQKKNGYYYIYLSTGSCCAGLSSTYHVVVGKSESVYGPYLGSNGKPIDTYNRGDTVVESHMTKGTGTGHCAIIQDSRGLDWIVYHAYDPNEEGWKQHERVLYIDRLYWNEKGYPLCKDRYPTHEEVPGPYLE